MKRSVNFSSPAKFAALAAMRGATAETWIAEPSAETQKRADDDCAILQAHHLYSLSAALSTAVNCVSKSEPRRNVGDLIYAGFDQGWRTSGLVEFAGPNGETRKAPSMMWADAMRAIARAEQLREQEPKP